MYFRKDYEGPMQEQRKTKENQNKENEIKINPNNSMNKPLAGINRISLIHNEPILNFAYYYIMKKKFFISLNLIN
jgi:hypothetical protein